MDSTPTGVQPDDGAAAPHSLSIQFGVRFQQVVIKLEAPTQVISLNPHQARHWAKMLVQLAKRAEVRPNPAPATGITVVRCQHQTARQHQTPKKCRELARWQDSHGGYWCYKHSNPVDRKPVEPVQG